MPETKDEKQLYALTDSEASDLRCLVDDARNEALADRDDDVYDDMNDLMIPLNISLDPDAAVERMARALYLERLGGYSELTWETEPEDVREMYGQEARAALEALTNQGSQSIRSVSAVPAALTISPDAMVIYSETACGQPLLTITKNVTKMTAYIDGSIRLDRGDGAFAVFADWTDDRVINLASLSREAAHRQGITIQEDQS